MATTTSEQIVREAPDIEAYKLGLLQSAKNLVDTPINIPAQQIAGMSQMQQDALARTQAGVGAYQPYLEQAGYTIGDSQQQIAGVMDEADPFRRQAADMMLQSQQGIEGQVGAAQAGINQAAGTIPGQIGAAQAGMGAAAGTIPGQIGAAQAGMAGAAAGGRGIASFAGQEAMGQAGGAQSGIDFASQQARGITNQAAGSLQQAGAMGRDTAMSGIGQLAGTTGSFDPASTGAFMNQYEDAAVQQALADIQRAGNIQSQGLDAQAVQAGAFGGSRGAIQQSELGRNILDQQARTAAGMRQQGFESAAQRAQQGFESAQGRAQQAAQLTGQLGQAGAGTSLQAAQAAGQLGLSAEQLAQQGALQGGQLGLSAAQAAGQMGLSAEQQAGQLAGQAGQLGLQGAQTRSDIAQQQGALGLQGAQARGQLAGQAGQLGLQGQELGSRIGEGIGNLGAQYGQLGLQSGQALGQTGLQQAQLGEGVQALGQQDASFAYDMGKQQQAQQQAVMEAKRSSEIQQAYEPYQRVSYLSDIYKGAPSSQQSITQNTSPNASPAQQILGLGIAGLGAAAGASKAGLF